MSKVNWYAPDVETCDVCGKSELGSVGIVHFPSARVTCMPPGWMWAAIDGHPVNVCSTVCAAKAEQTQTPLPSQQVAPGSGNIHGGGDE